MAKLVLAMFTSLDGYIEGPNGFVPPAWSGDLETHWSGHALERAGHLVYGRTNFLFNKEFWEPAETDPASPAAGVSHAAVMNRLPKTVVSSTLSGDPGWNASLAGPDLPAAIGALKASLTGKDIYCFGGAGVANSLISLDLVDEYRLMVTPVIFGDGKRLFGPGLPKLGLELVENRPLDTGAVILHYRRKHS
ncbi:dihydrofolate reductase family protein [Labrys sp. KNU-23]|uniref:dihydrofolate reductase family protein n=1 Tax=Labrys sp. KNU-23 TaxID=2789216 RepID=UPI00165C3AF6|nr:dihydrofolate reductase family protein [Labrys sp. KNU-23]